ncbi:MAG: hypothetical protein RL701_2338 [Pseudomonadota bacterium]|jgi:hypothetical protein
MNENVKRLRGLLALVGSAVENGATAVERVHKATAKKSFNALEQTPQIVAEPAAAVEEVHGAVAAGVYDTIRLITKSVVKTLDSVLDSVDPTEKTPDTQDPPNPTKNPK